MSPRIHGVRERLRNVASAYQAGRVLPPETRWEIARRWFGAAWPLLVFIGVPFLGLVVLLVLGRAHYEAIAIGLLIGALMGTRR